MGVDDARSIEESLSDLVAWATRHDVYQETMRRAGCDLPRAQLWLLARLAGNEPIRLGELATIAGIDKSTLTPQVQRLERDRFVVRSPDPSDGRASLLRLTRKGRSLIARLHRTRRDMITELLSDWPAHDVARASRILALLGERLARAKTAVVPPSPLL